MAINPNNKMVDDNNMEKSILRKAFQGYLHEILYRQKEQFSDGVGPAVGLIL